MAKKIQVVPPTCMECGVECALIGGAALYRNRRDLDHKWFWQCPTCLSCCGCHAGSKRPLGRPAGPAVRSAREHLHTGRIDPLWKNAVASVGYHPEDRRAQAIITNTARKRVYEYLAWKLGLDKDECHTAMFDLDMCRRAWRALSGITYPEIRTWAKERKRKKAEAAAQKQQAGAPSETA